MRLLIDECLSPALTRQAQQAGFEAYHLVHIGRAAWADWNIASYAVDGDMILVTNNATDFRRLYLQQEVHPGLIIVIPSADRDSQARLFSAALERLTLMRELVNKVLEASFEGDDVRLELYDWPPEGS